MTDTHAPRADAYPGEALIDHGAIAHNLRVLRAAAPAAKQMAVVKANAYGHGLLPVALTALASGSDWLGVAQLPEAVELREGLDRAGGSDFAGAIRAGIDLSVSWTWVLDAISAAARAVGRPARVHVKIDTGMSRAGSTLADLPALASALAAAQADGLVEVVGAWSHLSRGDDPSEGGLASTASHVGIFERGLRVLGEAGVRPAIRHLAATAGILWHPETHYDMVRAGIGLYGLSPDPAVADSRELGLRPAMTLRAPLTSVKVIERGAPVSYGGTWRAPTRRWAGLVPLGYGDGILRSASNAAPVVVRGPGGDVPARCAGRVCMDQFVIDLGPAGGAAGTPGSQSGAPPARVGDGAVLFGDPATGAPTADQWAEAAGTINYEVVTRLGAHSPRIHIRAGRSQ